MNWLMTRAIRPAPPPQYDGRDGKSLRSILQHAEIVGLEGDDHDHAEAVHQERIVSSFPQFVHGTKEIRLRFRPVGVHEPHGVDEEKIGTTFELVFREQAQQQKASLRLPCRKCVLDVVGGKREGALFLPRLEVMENGFLHVVRPIVIRSAGVQGALVLKAGGLPVQTAQAVAKQGVKAIANGIASYPLKVQVATLYPVQKLRRVGALEQARQLVEGEIVELGKLEQEGLLIVGDRGEEFFEKPKEQGIDAFGRRSWGRFSGEYPRMADDVDASRPPLADADKGFELVVIELHAIDVLHECLNLMPLEQEVRHIEQTAAGVKEQLAREDAGVFA